MTTDSQPPIVLLVYANDRVDPANHLRSLSAEINDIRDALQAAEQAGLCQVLIEANATANRIFSVFQDARYRDRIAVFHYAGHANGYQLLLESAAGVPGVADAGGLAAFLGQQQALALVFLNGCSTEPQAQGLLEANCDAVIVTSQEIDDDVAMNFASRFYEGLGGGVGLERAYNEAVAAVKTQAGRDPRALYWGDATTTKVLADRSPWELRIKPGAELARHWNLPDAVGNPLFGLPELPTLDLPESPFRHLYWFDREHAEVFFGRGFQIRELFQAVTTAGAAPIVLFYGQSGVGKSSVLAAGLLPRLEKTHRVHYLRRDQTRGLLGTLLAAFGDAKTTPGEAWRKAEGEQGPPILLVLDQAEEVFTRPNKEQPDELDIFIDGLHDIFGQPARRPRGRLILGFRKEWLPEIDKRLEERRLPRSRLFLETLDRRGVIEAITGPMRSARLQEVYKLEIEDGLADEIATDLLADRESPVAPTLQILLTKLWEQAREKNYTYPKFTRDDYLSLKSDGILLKNFLEQQLGALEQSRPEVVQSGLALDVLAYHTTPNGAAARTAEELRTRYPDNQRQAIRGLVEECKKGYLLSDIPSTQREPTAGTRLAHDTLAPLVRERFADSDRPGQRAQRILENRAVDWAKNQVGPMLDDADLKVVEKGKSGMRATTPDEARLIEASHKEQHRRRAARKRGLVLLGVLAVAVVLAGSFAAWQWWQLERAKEVRVKETIGYAWADLSARQEEVTRLTDVAKQNGLDPNELLAPSIETQEQPDKFNCNTSLEEGFRHFYCLVRKVISFGKLESISGLSIFSSGGPHNKEFNLSDPYQFGHYNPDFLEWFERHIIPKDINNVNQRVYDAYIGPTARALYHTHEILFAKPKDYRAFEERYQVVKEDYLEKLNSRETSESRFQFGETNPKAFEIIKAEYLRSIEERDVPSNKFDDSIGFRLNSNFRWLSDYLATDKHDDWYLAIAAGGFWVRRSIDGTEAQVFQLVKKCYRPLNRRLSIRSSCHHPD